MLVNHMLNVNKVIIGFLQIHAKRALLFLSHICFEQPLCIYTIKEMFDLYNSFKDTFLI